MTFLELLRQDCRDFEIVRQAHSKSSDAVSKTPRGGTHMVQSVHQDLMYVGVLVAVCGTLANLLRHDRADAGEARSLFRCFIPQQGLAPRDLSTTFSIEELRMVSALGNAESRLIFARRVTESWLGHSDDNVSLFVETTVLADAWQRAAAAILEADQALTSLVTECRLQDDGGVVTKISVALAEVVDGGAPCVDQFGRLSVPGWAERRVSERRHCDIDATVSFQATTVTCKVVNVSRTGFRLSQLAGTAPTGDLILTIQNRRLEGSVVWQRDDWLGAKWRHPLEASDDLLSGAAVGPINKQTFKGAFDSATAAIAVAGASPFLPSFGITGATGASRLSTFKPRR